MTYKILQKLEWFDVKPKSLIKRRFKRVLLFIFYPFVVLLDYIIYKIIWKKVFNELLTNDKVVQWLDKNEFSIEGSNIVKKDLITVGHPLFEKTEEEISLVIYNDYSNAFLNTLKDNVVMDVENYITIIPNITIYNSKIKIYEISIEYFKHRLMRRRLINLFMIFGTIFTIITILYIIKII